MPIKVGMIWPFFFATCCHLRLHKLTIHTVSHLSLDLGLPGGTRFVHVATNGGEPFDPDGNISIDRHDHGDETKKRTRPPHRALI